jgi:hypothetical protein
MSTKHFNMTRLRLDLADMTVQRNAMLAALQCALRAPGIHTTDQETGETFADVIRAAIARAVQS